MPNMAGSHQAFAANAWGLPAMFGISAAVGVGAVALMNFAVAD